jgi:hypothetical protein
MHIKGDDFQTILSNDCADDVKEIDSQPADVLVDESMDPMMLYFLLDVSGSMISFGSVVLNAFESVLLSGCRDDDLISCYTFNEKWKKQLELVKAEDAKDALDRMDIRYRGNTRMFDAINFVVDEMKQHHVSGLVKKDSVRELIVITDGKDNGSITSLRKLKAKLSAPGIPHFHLIILGVDGCLKSQLEDLCDEAKHLTFLPVSKADESVKKSFRQVKEIITVRIREIKIKRQCKQGETLEIDVTRHINSGEPQIERCRKGFSCPYGLKCRYWHSPQEIGNFQEKMMSTMKKSSSQSQVRCKYGRACKFGPRFCKFKHY